MRFVWIGAFHMRQASGLYVTSFQVEHLRRGNVRYHWIICKEDKPDDLVSWGHAPTQELAEAAARIEVEELSCGLSPGGRVTRRGKSLLANCGLAGSDRFDIPLVKGPTTETRQQVKE